MPTDYGTAATLISLFPLPIYEKKPLIPSIYQIDASTSEAVPEILIVREGRFHVYLDEFRGMMTIRTPALTIAESIVRDFMDSQYMASEGARPAFWCIPGAWTVEEIYSTHEDRILSEAQTQLEWFKRLILIADDEWAKFHQHRMITEVQKVAAARLRVNREWAIEYTPENNADCPGCGALINKKVAVCRECGCIINKELYESLEFTSGAKREVG